MEAPSLMNKGYSTMHQQKQLQSPATMQSNNKQFGVGNHGHMMPRPLYSSPPIVGQKRDSSAFDLGQGVSQDGGNFVKLFVGHLPRNVTEDDIRSLFAEHGNVLEVSLVRDNKRIGQQHGCCFIKYATVEEAERAIKALHNQHTLQGGVGPLQVRYADGEREQLGTVEHKLFVGSLNKQATEKEIEEIFTPYGTVDDVYIMRDEQKQSRGCAFVKFPSREMAAAAISGLNGAYVMRGCNQPLAVRFAEPKRPKPGDTRGSPAYGGPGFGTELQRSFGSRPSLGVGSHMGGRGTPTNWRLMGAANMRTPPPQVGPNPYVSPSNPSVRGGSAGGPPPMGGPVSGSGSSANGPPIRAHISSPMGGPGRMPAPSQQLSFNSSPAQRQTQAHGWSASVLQPRQMQQQLQPPMQQQQQLQPPMQQQHTQSQPSFSQLQPQQSLQQYGQQFQTSQPVGQQQQHPFAQASASQQPLSLYAQFAVSQPPVQQPVAPLPHQTAPSLPLPTMQLQHQQQSQPQSQQQPALQLVHQHSHALQPNFQSQQHSSLQQQQHAPLMQTATQTQQQPITVQPQQQQAYYQMASTQQPAQQQPWTFSVQTQAVASTVSVGPASVVPTTITVAAATAAATAPVTAPIAAAVTCVWSEHTSPEGHKYYYNSVTGESKWEKPEELTVFEQQQQAKHLQQPRLQPQSQPQLQSQQQPQPQLQAQPQLQPQPQLQSQQQQQQQAQLMSSNLSYGQLQAPNTTVNPVHHYAQQQSLPATQDWMWKARPAGT